ncbi:hypothetical protein [Priestia megaterium]|uniref:hypothetical protein n=1 Tax=Priestia megaterium TaxID=1404 RepID=UPI0024528683|nr:hypothetical protein [Priestia megaterium]MDH3139061.1 hypothetical protein [Priestia megaterium]MED4235900.1 hypothetical protein [Priestia megaterium]MED4268117.1 hypothetical protein [Priestia megaterium]MED4279587.1 hypothetical protein [Priestia megaterium]MED4318722.1 hypothetical protein [Priestia megaterium]
MKELVINDVVFDVKYFTTSTVSKEEVGLEKRIINNNGKMTKGRDQIKFSFSVLGQQDYQLYDSFFENTRYTVIIPETSERFIAHSVSHSTFYQGAEVADDTEVVFKVTLTK